jgi:hypothetical protein
MLESWLSFAATVENKCEKLNGDGILTLSKPELALATRWD